MMKPTSLIRKNLEHLVVRTSTALKAQTGEMPYPCIRRTVARILFGERIVILPAGFLEECFGLPPSRGLPEIMECWDTASLLAMRERYLPELDALEWRAVLRIADRLLGDPLFLASGNGCQQSASSNLLICNDWRRNPLIICNRCHSSGEALMIALRLAEAVHQEIPFPTTPSHYLTKGRPSGETIVTGFRAIPEIAVHPKRRLTLRFSRQKTLHRMARLLLKIGEFCPENL